MTKWYNSGMNDFNFHSPTKFVFGRDCFDSIGGELSARSLRKALIVYGGGSAVRSGVLMQIGREDARAIYESAFRRMA